MLAKVLGCAVIGLEGVLVEVEVDVSNGFPAFTIIGVPDAVVNEARERIRSALNNSSSVFLCKHVIVKLAPANLCTEGLVYDLPIAIGVLLASGQINHDVQIGESLFLGELSVDGRLHHTNGILSMVALASEKQIKTVFVPAADALEAALIQDIAIYPIETLGQLIAHLNWERRIEPFLPDPQVLNTNDHISSEQDMTQIRRQEHVKRALEVAASGGHNILLSRPPGPDITLLARCMPSILPPLVLEESLEVTKIYSASGMLPTDHPLILQRPLRAPHHRISQADFVGGGRIPRPGEMSLAHRGVLFLDELPEWGQDVLQVLWQSLEDRMVTISREQGTLTYPAHFLVVASMKQCPCGFFSDPVKACTCTASAIARYHNRISGPLLDKIDIHIEVPHIDYEKLAEKRKVETSHTIRKRVQAARERQLQRFAGTKLTCNAQMGPSEVHDFCMVEPSAEQVFKAAMQQLHMSAGTFHRVLRLAQTIADLAKSDVIAANHVAEAMWYRPRVGR